MTDTPASAIPAGWYDDATTPGQLRWWDGTAWTEHTAVAAAPASGTVGNAGGGAVSAPASAAAYVAVAQRPLLPADRPVYSPFIWLIVLLPLVSLATIFAWQPTFRFVSGVDGAPTIDPLSIYTPGYFAVLAAGWIGYGLAVFFAYRDVVWLRRQGVVRPFHWAWTFLYSPVYVIGRSVIVHRVAAPRGRAPIWAFIAVFVLSIILSISYTATLMSGIIEQVGLNR